MLGGAAGEVLAAGQDRVYGYLTQHNVITSYHLLRRGTIDPTALGSEFAALAFPETGFDVYRAVAPWFRAWLDEHQRGSSAPMPFGNAGAAARMIPIGVWFRKDPVALVEEAIRGAMITHNQEGAVVAACSFAGAIAGASFGQSGRDLVFGAAEVAKRAEARIGDLSGTVASPDGSPPLSLLLRHAAQLVGKPFARGRRSDSILDSERGFSCRSDYRHSPRGSDSRKAIRRCARGCGHRFRTPRDCGDGRSHRRCPGRPAPMAVANSQRSLVR